MKFKDFSYVRKIELRKIKLHLKIQTGKKKSWIKSKKIS